MSAQRIAGFGFRAGAGLASLEDALIRAGGAAGVSALAVPADKADAGAVRRLARQLGLTLHAVPPGRLSAVATPTRSAHSLAHRGTGSVAEAAALAAARALDPRACLTRTRRISGDRQATCAIATVFVSRGAP
ncbi:cobalt-precorrin 5A hydrolase [Rhodothalassium salexigens DSM 2132]|uniref:Cobalt-precorrin 5A hydrolase n=1 Tax=Rhodothalassium salexigens DSM 2132 TaxID=1188247 RepID=A0A4R2PH33_RHOSA|nr:cobalamin biosynthesis protein [Rhodothalassium salexigens]MBB4211521.1 cobalt-precorrin 5A hydrolase [Rhodothalassium salexigens DSM 2132]MBK1640200.1 hypothetical protein [Rhodothalassium salexigens DSM 2132]TCP34547.1 cobalt-precorrin 5A hydrolase [Rhodothalassium salexigens DSM 2132]